MPADKLHITLAGSEHVVEDGTTAGQVLADRDQASQTTIAARVNGEPRDLAYELADGDRVEQLRLGQPSQSIDQVGAQERQQYVAATEQHRADFQEK